ncbi:MAG: crossover junction endodeoxyribonuclease RuvC, partial [Cetobacterium sp.]
MRKVLVIDQATLNLGYNIIEIDENKIRWVECDILKIRGSITVGRICQVMKFVIQTIKTHNITDLVLEDVPLDRKTNIKTMVVLLKLLGCLEAVAFNIGIECHIMNVKNWKALAGIRSRTRDLQKSESIQLSLKRWSQYSKAITSNGDDVSDSLNIGLAWLVKNGYV